MGRYGPVIDVPGYSPSRDALPTRGGDAHDSARFARLVRRPGRLKRGAPLGRLQVDTRATSQGSSPDPATRDELSAFYARAAGISISGHRPCADSPTAVR